MTAPVFSPGIAPSFAPRQNWNWPSLLFEPIKPYETIIPLGIRPVRQLSVEFRALNSQQRAYIIAFFHAINGPATAFAWPGFEPIWAPEYSGLELTQVSGGALAQRTYYVRYTWYDDASGGETTSCAAESITVAANYVMRVTVPPPPIGAKGFRIYAHETQGVECLQGTVLNSRTWTESVSGLVTGTPVSPLSNTLQPDLLWRLVGGLEESKVRSNRWSMWFTIQEAWV